MRQLVAELTLVLLVLALASSAALGQKDAVEEVLRFSALPSDVTLLQGGQAEIRIDVQNRSIYKAEDIDFEELVPDIFRIVGDPEPIALIDAFQSESVILTVEVSADAPLGEHRVTIEIYYTYCEGELCFQMADSLDLRFFVEPELDVQTPSSTVSGPDVQTRSATGSDDRPPRGPGDLANWRGWLVFLGAGVSLAGILVGNGKTALRRMAFLALLLLGASLLGGGILFGQHDQAQSIGAVLCISCVGIEVAQDVHHAELSPSALEALSALQEDVHLIVFSAEWCHACPFAKEMVGQVAEASDWLTFEVVDVDADPQQAIDAGIVESGRTIVPAIVREGFEDVIYGTERLESRLLELLGVEP